ncbi:unnamed protein product, partial [Ectocarpus sp. 4 AP-2014]
RPAEATWRTGSCSSASFAAAGVLSGLDMDRFGRYLALSREVRVHGDEEGSASIQPAMPPQSAIARTQAKIEAVEKEIEAVKTALSGGPAYLGITDDCNLLLEQLNQLREAKEQLREAKEQLREMELRQLRAQASLPTP